MQIVFSGIIFGCIYGLAALGLVLIFKTTDVVNFSHGEMAMVTTFVSFVLLTRMELPYFPSFVLATLFAIVLGMIIYFGIMKWVQSAPLLNQMVVTLGLYLILNGLAGFIFGRYPHSYPLAIEGDPMKIAGAFVTPNDLFILGVTIILVAIFFLIFKYTKAGLAMQAAQQDIFAAKLMGINISSVFVWTWGVGAALGGVAGMMTAPLTFLDTNMMLNILIMSFAAAVLGGFNSFPSILAGGLLIGVFENLISYYIAPELKLVYIFVLLIAILYVRPQGIFGGAKMVKKV